MSGGESKLQAMLTTATAITQGEKPKELVRASAIKSGLTEQGEIDYFMSLKRGPLNTYQMTFKCDGEVQSVINFRLLTTAEEMAIEVEVMQETHEKLQWMTNQKVLKWLEDNLRVAKTLSAATKPWISSVSTKGVALPEYSEAFFLNMPTTDLKWAMNQYLDHKAKYSPSPDDLTEDDLKEIVDALNRLDSAPNLDGGDTHRKKLDLLMLLDCSTICETLIYTQQKLATITEQVGNLFTPSE